MRTRLLQHRAVTAVGALAMFGVLALAAGCDNEPDTAGEAVDQAIENTQDAADDAADAVNDAVDDTADELDDAADDLGDELDDSPPS